MSRTIKGSKGPGYDYWSRRANSGKWLTIPGEYTKRITNRRERRKKNQELEYNRKRKDLL